MNAKSLVIADIAAEWLKDPAFKTEYDALEEEFSLAAALIRARLAKATGDKQRIRSER